MNVLFLGYRFPYPADRGDRLTLFHLLRATAARHRVTLVSFVDGSEPAEAFARVGEHCAGVETVQLGRARSWAQAWLGLFSTLPSQVSYFRSSAMRRKLDALLATGRFDAVFTHTLRMAPYMMDRRHPASVLWLCDSLGLVLGRSVPFEPWWKRAGIEWERWRVDRWEARISGDFTESWAISQADLEDLRRVGCERLRLMTHGVDERLFDLARRPAGEPRVMFLGNLSVRHNIDAAVFAATEVFPRIRAAHPQARLVLAGASPTAEVLRLRALEGVDVPGTLPDLLPLWEVADVLLAPLRFSTGIQNKLLEAMAAGVPVVTTPSAADALGAVNAEHAMVAEDARGLADAVLDVVAHPGAAQTRAERARELVRERFSWDAAVRRMEELAAAPPPT